VKTVIDDLMERGVAFIPASDLQEEASRVMALARQTLSGLSACPPLEERTMFPKALANLPGPSRRVAQCFLSKERGVFESEPPEISNLRAKMSDLCMQLCLHAVVTIIWLGNRAGVSLDVIRELCNPAEWVLNAAHYPFDGKKGDILFPAHRDWGTLAIYPMIEGAGLEMNINGTWEPVEVPPGHMLCYAGDIFGRVTDGRVKPLLHRVVQPVDGQGSRTALIFYADTVRTMRLPGGQLVNDIIESKLKKIGQI